MPPELIGFLFIVAVGSFTVITVARVFTNRSRSLPDGLTERVQELEHTVQNIQQELTETQERLDFAERLLSAAREDRRLEQ
jgi:hypothetical protein